MGGNVAGSIVIVVVVDLCCELAFGLEPVRFQRMIGAASLSFSGVYICKMQIRLL